MNSDLKLTGRIVGILLLAQAHPYGAELGHSPNMGVCGKADEMDPKRQRFFLILVLASAAVVTLGWAASALIPRRAPPLVVEEWISPPPDTAGKLVMLEFWATWCGPCVAAIPDHNELQRRFRDNLVIIAISDEPAEVVRKQADPTIAYASAIDTQARMSRALGVSEIPATFILDPDGMIRWKGDPFLHHNADRNREMWDELMNDLLSRYTSR